MNDDVSVLRVKVRLVRPRVKRQESGTGEAALYLALRGDHLYFRELCTHVEKGFKSAAVRLDYVKGLHICAAFSCGDRL